MRVLLDRSLFLRMTLACSVSLSATAGAANLLDVMRDALANDAQYRAALAQRDASAERLPQARAGLLPTFTLSGNSQWNDTSVTQPYQGSAQYNTHAFTFQLTQPLFRWQNWVQFQQGELQVVAADAQLAQAGQDVMLRAAQAYFDLLYADEVVKSIQAQKAAAAAQVEQAKLSFEVGSVTITDVHEAQSRFDLANAQEIAAHSDLQIKRYALAMVTGSEPGRLSRLRDDVALERPAPDDMEQWVASAEQGNFAVAGQQATLEIASREVSRQFAGHYPTLDAIATHGEAKSLSVVLGAPVPNETKTSTIGVQASLPLFQGFGQQSRVREAEYLLDKAQADLEVARRNAAQSARQAYLGVSDGIARIRALQAATVSSQSALASNQLGYQVGVRINIDVLNAQQQVFVTQRDLAKARLDTLAAQLKLKAAAGQLGEPELRTVNALLE